MPRRTQTPLPSVGRTLATLGENIRLARKRRRLSASLVAERAGMSRTTLASVEKGEPGVTLGAVVNVLHVLGLVDDVARVARDDALGRKLQDLDLEPETRRTTRLRRSRTGDG